MTPFRTQYDIGNEHFLLKQNNNNFSWPRQTNTPCAVRVFQFQSCLRFTPSCSFTKVKMRIQHSIVSNGYIQIRLALYCLPTLDKHVIASALILCPAPWPKTKELKTNENWFTFHEFILNLQEFTITHNWYRKKYTCNKQLIKSKKISNNFKPLQLYESKSP